MMSRSLYKGLKIEYYPDECNVPVPRVERAPMPPPMDRKVSSKSRPSANIYALLAEDGGSDSSDAEEDTASEEQADSDFIRHGVKFYCADSVAVA